MSEWTSGKTSFNLDPDAGVFTVTGDLDFPVEREFQRACAELLDGAAREVFVDLTGVSFICSSCIGSLFLLQDNASTRHMKLRVRLSRKIAPICKMMGLHELVDDLEVG